jgi:hypothetical protein
MPTTAQVNAALRTQIKNCLVRANNFLENPQSVIAEAKTNGGPPSGIIGHVAFGLASLNPALAERLKAIADEIDGVAEAYQAEKLSPVPADAHVDRLRHLREMIATVDIDHL